MSPVREPVLRKRQNYDLWRRGVWGNKLPSWRSPGAWKQSGYHGHVALRVLLPGGNGPCFYNLPPAIALDYHAMLIKTGIASRDITIDAMAPSDLTTLQGEYLNDALDWGYFLHSKRRVPMREAIRYWSEVSRGLRSHLLLKSAMTAASWEDWQVLLALYPGHVLEVSVYDCCLGDLPGRNALVWEVRRY